MGCKTGASIIFRSAVQWQLTPQNDKLDKMCILIGRQLYLVASILLHLCQGSPRGAFATSILVLFWVICAVSSTMWASQPISEKNTLSRVCQNFITASIAISAVVHWFNLSGPGKVLPICFLLTAITTDMANFRQLFLTLVVQLIFLIDALNAPFTQANESTSLVASFIGISFMLIFSMVKSISLGVKPDRPRLPEIAKFTPAGSGDPTQLGSRRSNHLTKLHIKSQIAQTSSPFIKIADVNQKNPITVDTPHFPQDFEFQPDEYF